MRTWAPPPRLTVSKWSDAHRQLSPESSSEPGRWRTSRAEYQRGIMDAANDPDIDTLVFKKSSQVGATEIINNITAYFIDQDPSPMLVVQPTLEMAQSWSKDRFNHMVRDSERLRYKIKPPRTRDSNNTILHKTFPGGHLTAAGANSAASLASRPIRFVLCDEIDRYPASAGNEGDPVELAWKRALTFWNRLLVLVSTPTIKDMSRIEAAFEESDQRYFHIPCPECGTMQRLYWRQVKWEKDAAGNHLPETACYQCEACAARWNDAQRWAAVAVGEWQATNPKAVGMAGFHISALYSPWVALAQMVDAFIKAKDNPERLKVFVNTMLGETWEDDGETRDHHALYARREEYPAEVPMDGLVLVAGVDVQDDRLEGEVRAYGAGEESWGVEYFRLFGDPQRAELWARLDDQLSKTYEHESGLTFKISAACIDSGGHHTEQVYRFVQPREYRRIYAVKGSNTIGSPLISLPSRKNKGRVQLFSVGTDTAKEALYKRLQIVAPGPAYLHFPAAYDEEYFEQLTAEKAVTKYRNGFPQRIWIKIRPRNEALDVWVYGYAALAILNPDFAAIERRLRARLEEDEQAEAKGPERPHRRNWITGYRR